MFLKALHKVAFISRHSDEALIRATPKKLGGSHGHGRYFLRYHDNESRWSCTCPDWSTRRKWLPEKFKKHWDCKHIAAHTGKSSTWDAKKNMPRLTRQIMDDAKELRLELLEQEGSKK